MTTAVIELVYILHAVAVACSEARQKKCFIKFGELENFIYDVLWQEERIATYSTSLDLERDLEKLASLDIIRYESGEVVIEVDEFLKKIAPFELVARNMTAGNSYLKYVIQRIKDRAREYAARNIKGLAPQPA
jgi:hypothetical protein